MFTNTNKSGRGAARFTTNTNATTSGTGGNSRGGGLEHLRENKRARFHTSTIGDDHTSGIVFKHRHESDSTDASFTNELPISSSNGAILNFTGPVKLSRVNGKPTFDDEILARNVTVHDTLTASSFVLSGTPTFTALIVDDITVSTTTGSHNLFSNATDTIVLGGTAVTVNLGGTGGTLLTDNIRANSSSGTHFLFDNVVGSIDLGGNGCNSRIENITVRVATGAHNLFSNVTGTIALGGAGSATTIGDAAGSAIVDNITAVTTTGSHNLFSNATGTIQLGSGSATVTIGGTSSELTVDDIRTNVTTGAHNIFDAATGTINIGAAGAEVHINHLRTRAATGDHDLFSNVTGSINFGGTGCQIDCSTTTTLDCNNLDSVGSASTMNVGSTLTTGTLNLGSNCTNAIQIGSTAVGVTIGGANSTLVVDGITTTTTTGTRNLFSNVIGTLNIGAAGGNTKIDQINAQVTTGSHDLFTNVTGTIELGGTGAVITTADSTATINASTFDVLAAADAINLFNTSTTGAVNLFRFNTNLIRLGNDACRIECGRTGGEVATDNVTGFTTTGAHNLFSNVTGTINLAGAGAQIQCGSTSTELQCDRLNSLAGNATMQIGSSLTTGEIQMGHNMTTGTVSIGQNMTSGILNLASLITTGTVNIADSATTGVVNIASVAAFENGDTNHATPINRVEGLYIETSTTSDHTSIAINETNASAAKNLIKVNCGRTSSTAYNFSSYYINGARTMKLDGTGQLFLDNTTIGTPADYAEYFESKNKKIRIGDTVVVNEQGYIEKATKDSEDDDIIGVVRPKFSGASLVTNSHDNGWQGRFIPHPYGGFKMFPTLDEDGNQIYTDEGFPAYGKKENPDYKPDENYKPRRLREEWYVVGLVGQVIVNPRVPVNSRWKFMGKTRDNLLKYLVR